MKATLTEDVEIDGVRYRAGTVLDFRDAEVAFGLSRKKAARLDCKDLVKWANGKRMYRTEVVDRMEWH